MAHPKFSTGSLRHCARAVAVAALVLFSTAAASAVPLKTYRQRLHEAQVGLTALMFNDNESAANAQAQFTETLGIIRASLPADQLVEWNGGSMQVDNSWLQTALGQLEATPAGDRQRNDRIVEITERLTSIDARAEELEKAESADALTRDEAKARLAEILRRKEFAHEQAKPSAFERIAEQIANWVIDLLKRLLPQPRPISAGPSAFIGFIARILVLVLAVALIAFVLWKLIPRMFRGRGRKKARKAEARVVLGETLDADQTGSDIWDEAEALARAGNIRAAIRKGYIALLCELGDRKIVGLAQHKTNRDYLGDVRERRALFDDMRQLTNTFEYHWYGSASATKQDWDTFRTGYRQALSRG
jgi:hypothetical protein